MDCLAVTAHVATVRDSDIPLSALCAKQVDEVPLHSFLSQALEAWAIKVVRLFEYLVPFWNVKGLVDVGDCYFLFSLHLSEGNHVELFAIEHLHCVRIAAMINEICRWVDSNRDTRVVEQIVLDSEGVYTDNSCQSY